MRSAAVAVLAGALALGAAGAARAQNMIPDPAFTRGVGAWTPMAITGNFSMTFVPGFSQRPGSGSGFLSFTGAASGAFTVCLPVAGGRSYDWGYSVYFPDPARIPGLNEWYSAYDGPGCTGPLSGFGGVLPIFPTQAAAWFSPKTTLRMPATSQSFLAGFTALGVGGAQPLAYVDDVFFAPAGTVPPIDPPADIPSLSGPGLLACAAALALAGARVLPASRG